MIWDPHAPFAFLASTEDGHVYCCDARKPGQTIFSLSAHDASVTSITMTALCPGLLVTGSVDKSCKVRGKGSVHIV
jgi:periodic tryptophan protein 1